MLSSTCSLGVSSYFFILLSTDCFMFIYPTRDTKRFVNRSGDISFIWKYVPPNQKEYRDIDCGYVSSSVNDWIVSRRDREEPIVHMKYKNRIDYIFDNNKTAMTLGFKLKNCQFAVAGKFGCSVLDSYKSKVYFLNVDGELFIFDQETSYIMQMINIFF